MYFTSRTWSPACASPDSSHQRPTILRHAVSAVIGLAACRARILATLSMHQAKFTPNMPHYGLLGCGASTSLLQSSTSSPTNHLLQGLTLDIGIIVSTNHMGFWWCLDQVFNKHLKLSHPSSCRSKLVLRINANALAQNAAQQKSSSRKLHYVRVKNAEDLLERCNRTLQASKNWIFHIRVRMTTSLEMYHIFGHLSCSFIPMTTSPAKSYTAAISTWQ